MREAARKEFEQRGAELNWLHREVERFDPISGKQHKATAMVITENDPDIMALVKVESMEALRKFNSTEFFGKKRFPYFMLIDGNDPRGFRRCVAEQMPDHAPSVVHARHLEDAERRDMREVAMVHFVGMAGCCM